MDYDRLTASLEAPPVHSLILCLNNIFILKRYRINPRSVDNLKTEDIFLLTVLFFTLLHHLSFLILVIVHGYRRVPRFKDFNVYEAEGIAAYPCDERQHLLGQLPGRKGREYLLETAAGVDAAPAKRAISS